MTSDGDAGEEPRGGPSAETVAPLQRGLGVLRVLAAAPHAMTPGALVRETALARSTVDRIVSTLDHVGFVRADGRTVALAPPLMRLGDAYLAAAALPPGFAAAAERLADALDESVSVAVPDRDGVRFVCQATRRRTLSVSFRVGDLLPAERCAPGALFAPEWSAADRAAWRERLRADPGGGGFSAVPPPPAAWPADPARIEQEFGVRVAAAAQSGWAADDQFTEPGLIAVAVPVRDGAGRCVCAVSVVSHTSRHDIDSLRALALGPLLAAARALESALAHAGTPTVPLRQRPVASATESGHELATAPDREMTRASVLDDSKQQLGPLFLRSLARGLDVLAAFAHFPAHRCASAAATEASVPTLSALAQVTGLPRATVRRALITLQDEGYVEARGRRFVPLPRVLELGYSRLAGLSLEQVAAPHLARLAARTGESASVAVLDEGRVAYVARAATRRIMQANITVGTRFPAHATSMGRVLLAALPEPRRREALAAEPPRALTRFTVTDPQALAALLDRVAADGHALVDQELEEGLRALAAPVRDGAGTVVAAVNVSLPAAGESPEASRVRVLPALLDAAAAISADVAAMGRHLVVPYR